MHENTVQVAQFHNTEEALGARLRLEAEEIACTLSEESPSPTDFSIFGRMNYAPIRLYVAASQAERAAEILASKEPLELDENWQAQAESAVEGWICHNCDTPVEESATECPECATPRRIRKKKRK
jgi:rubrerythrin